MAAQRSAADAHTAQDLGLIAHADLAKLDSCAEDARKVLDQVTEVDAAVGCEVKEYLAVVKCVLSLDELHLKSALRDLFLADLVGFLLFPAVLRLPLVIFGRCHADHVLQRLRNFLVLELHRAEDDCAVLDAARGLYDDVVIVVNVEIARIKIVYFTYVSEFYSDNCCHLLIPLYITVFTPLSCPRMSGRGVRR